MTNNLSILSDPNFGMVNFIKSAHFKNSMVNFYSYLGCILAPSTLGTEQM